MKKLLCKIGIHDWDYYYFEDKSIGPGRFHITSAVRTCKRCSKKQWSLPEDGSNRIRYEK